MPHTRSLHNRWRPGLFVFVCMGVVLRLWNWSSQILLDDEWHAINFVSGRSFGEVLYQQGMGANSIPVNIYAWLVLHTVGWSEPVLRLPSMLCGVAALVLIPLLVRRIWGEAVALVCGALLAVSPVVIFYCRNIRPYSPAMLFGTLSVLLTLLWFQDGRRRSLLASALCGSMAIYWHLYTAIPVGLPLVVAAVAALPVVGTRLGLTVASRHPIADVLLAGSLLIAIDGLLVVAPNVLNPWWASGGIHNMDRATWQTAVTVMGLLAGSGWFWLKYLFAGLVVAGLILTVRESRIRGVAVALPFLLFTTVMAITTQDGSHAGIQAVRYGITFAPLSFIMVAVAVVTFGEALRRRFEVFATARWLTPACALILWAPFVITSPLWTIYRLPNNFTNHSGYQYRYDAIEWSHSPERDLAPGISIPYNEIPLIYRQPGLRQQYHGIIEYPMPIGDHLNPYFYYQHFHHLPVVAGFLARDDSDRYPQRGEWVYADKMVDYVVSGVPSELLRKATSWRNMVDLEDVARIKKQYSGWLIILHRNPVREIQEHIPEDATRFYGSPDLPLTPMAGEYLTGIFGSPMMQTSHVAVWVVR